MSREEAIRRLTEIKGTDKVEYEYIFKNDKVALEMAIQALEQKSKIGHWIIIDDCEQFIAKCSECGRIEDSRMISKYPYCHCGARMVEQKERNEQNEQNERMSQMRI